MKGLLIKDYHLLAQQRRYLLLIAGIGIMLSITQNEPSFVTGYITFIVSLLSISSISYDEFDNGMAFLMTLPSGRKAYVCEKYLLSVINVVGAVVLANIAVIICSFFNTNGSNWDLKENAVLSLVIGAVVLIILSIMIPIALKYGVEKSRMIQFGVFGFIFLVFYLSSKVASTFFPKPERLFTAIVSVPETVWGVIAVGIVILVIAVSHHISVKIMMKKEF